MIVTDFERAPKRLIEEFRKLFTGCISDALNKQGAMCSEIKPVIEDVKIAGPAFTARTHPGDVTTVVKALEMAEEGDILVIDARGNRETALWGELLTRNSMLRGLEGVVIDGATRDILAVKRLRFPLFVRAVVPSNGITGYFGDINVPIECGGVPIEPEDIVVGDDDGVVIVPKSRADETLKIAKSVADVEEKIKKGLEEGRTVGESIDIDSLVEEPQKKVVTPQMRASEERSE